MRAAAILAFMLCTICGARADAPDSAFRIGAWQGTPMDSDGAFAFCGMTAIYGQKDAPVALTIGLDRDLGWMVAMSSDQFKLPLGKIKAGLAFDDEAPIDVQGDVKSPIMMSFRFDKTDNLDRHIAAKKLVLIFRDVALPFTLPQFAEAAKALRSCLQTNMPPIAATAALEPLAPQADVAASPVPPPMPAPSRAGTARQSRLFVDLIEPLFVGFAGSVLIVILAGCLIFGVARARMKTRYQEEWSREYRTAPTPVAPASILHPLARHRTDASVAA